MDEKYIGHSFNSDYSILKAAFSLLKEKQESHFNTLRSYSGFNKEQVAQINWEDKKIADCEQLMLKLYEKYLMNKKELSVDKVVFGYYWVKISDNDNFIIAEYDQHGWWLIGSECNIPVTEILQIESKIER